jgi:hypothetical protein
MAVEIPPFPDISSHTHFPLPESNWMEYKETFPRLKDCFEKQVLLPVCGFLNSSGGYLVIGVVDADRFIKGVPTDKMMDAFMLKIDDIIRHQYIRPSDDSYLLPENLKVSYVTTKYDKTIVIVKVVPTPGKEYYCTKIGKVVRLSASNLKISSLPQFNTEEEEKIMRIVKKRMVASKCEKMRMRYEHEFEVERLSKQLEYLVGKTKELEKNIQTEQEIHQRTLVELEKRILQEKFQKEEELSTGFWKKIASVLCFAY